MSGCVSEMTYTKWRNFLTAFGIEGMHYAAKGKPTVLIKELGMFTIRTKAKDQHTDDINAGNQHALRSWSQCLGRFGDEYERFMPVGGEHRTPQQPLPPSTAAGFVC